MSTLIQRSLSGGELCPQLWPRTDTAKYGAGLRTLRNAFVLKTGGVSSRAGTTMVAQTKDTTALAGFYAPARLIEFVFSLTQTYIIELGHGYIRFHQNGSPILVSGVLAYSGSHAYSIADLVVSSGINYYCLQAGTGQTPASSPLYWYPLTGNIYEIPSNYDYADLPLIRYAQSGDVITLTNPNFAPRELKRFGNTNWTLATILYGSSVLAPTSLTNTGSSGSLTQWLVTSVDKDTGEECAMTSGRGAGTAPATTGCLTVPIPNGSPGGPVTVILNFTPNPNAAYSNVYRLSGQTFGFIGSTTTSSFVDQGQTADVTNVIQLGSNPFSGVSAWPTACAYYQQRIIYSNTYNNPTRTWGSQTGLYYNFNVHTPAIGTDSLSFSMAGNQDSVQHLLNLGHLIVFTSGSETSILGDANYAISPASINPKQESVHGCSIVRPLVVNGYAIYNQARGSIIRDLGYNFQVDGYRGDDLTIFASHLFENYTIVDWAYQQTPNSIIWAVRSDGILVSLTYVREQQILAWHHHDTDGLVENVCVVPEGNEDVVYFIVNRTINGSAVRFVERMATRQVSNVVNYIGMDCTTTWDGTNITTDTMTISGGTNWDSTELLTVTRTGSGTIDASWAAQSNQIVFTAADGSIVRFNCVNYVSLTVVTGFVDRTVPVSLQGAATLKWARAITVVAGLDYLDGKNVSVFADGFVVGSPNNSAYPVYTVTSGYITLDKAYVVGRVGLPFTVDIETLDIDTASTGDTLADKEKFVGEVTVFMQNSRPAFIGPVNPDTDLTNTANDPLLNLVEMQVRQNEPYDSPVGLITGKHVQTISGRWDSNGHVFIRNVDPTPVMVAAIAADGLYPFNRGG